MNSSDTTGSSVGQRGSSTRDDALEDVPGEASVPEALSPPPGSDVSLPLVSVVIPTHNRVHLLPRALRSVLEQTYPALEVLVVDDASTDETVEWLAGVDDPRLRVLRFDVNRGACAARNAGIDQASGSLIAFLDSDDAYVPTKIEKQVAALTRLPFPAYGAVTCGAYEVRPGRRDTVWVPTEDGDPHRALWEHRRVGIGPQHLLCRREVFHDGDVRFDETLPARQDFDFAAQLLPRYGLGRVREALVYIYHHSGERVYTPQRSVVASHYLRRKYADWLEAHPDLAAIFALRLVRMHAALGAGADARSEARRAFRIRPGLVTGLWVAFAQTLRGGRLTLAHRALLKALLRLTFGQRRRTV